MTRGESRRSATRGHSGAERFMQPAAGAPRRLAAEKVTESPAGTVTLLVTHMPNISAAFRGRERRRRRRSAGVSS